MAGVFTWFDLMSTDPNAAIVFYTKTLGWTTQKWDGPMDYTMFVAAGETLGGVMLLPDEAKNMGAPSHWLGYISTDDLAASLAKAASLEARVYKEATEIPGVGKFAVLADPQGATFALFQSSNPSGDGSLKALSWCELATDDPEGALAFYGALCGWHATEAMDMGPAGTYQMFGVGDKGSIGGILKRNPQVPVSAWGYYFNADDCHARVATAKASGAHALYEPMQVPGGGWASLLADPTGAVYGIVGPAK